MKVSATFFLALMISGSTAVASTELFGPEDALCFPNKDPSFKKAIPVLGGLALKKGACQGMSAIVSAFQERVEFSPQAEKISTNALKRQIKDLLQSYRRGCPLQSIQISGFANLRELCESHRQFFIRQSLLNNADIAIHEVAQVLIDFLVHKQKPIQKAKDQEDLARTIRMFQELLAQGQKPLILTYSHVRTVLGVDVSTSTSGQKIYVLWLYDSNPNGLQRFEVKLDAAGLPALGQPKFWNATPDRGC